MKKIILCWFVTCLAGLFGASAHEIIPQPLSFREQGGEFVWTDSCRYSVRGELSAELRDYVEALPWRLYPVAHRGEVEFCVGRRVKLSAEEGYRLTVSERGVRIEALTEAGAFYALQTLQQLAVQDGGERWRVPCCEVEDAPRFPYRGVMLDVSRNFRSKEFVRKQLDAMARFKFNRLHLHLTDGAGWRLEIRRYPLLTEVAAWRPARNWFEWWHGDRKYCRKDHPLACGGYYTREDVREMVEYARRLHITIIPEIEMPGHSEEVLAVYPELSCSGIPYREASFCPGNEEVYRFLENVLTEVMELFPSELIHIGGDEAGKESWKSCPKCQARMRSEGFTEVEQLQSYLVHRIGRFLEAHGRRLLGWDEILEGGLAPGATVMSWRGEEGGLKALRAGHDAVMTPGEFCYLDYAQDAPFTQPLSIGGYTPLRKVYDFAVEYPGLTPEQEKHLLGIQANLFTEYVPTDEHAEYMLYPRVLAVAEAAWSRPAQRAYADFHRRALVAVERLQRDGYHPFDLKNEYGQRPESAEPVAHKAVGKPVRYASPWHRSYPAAGEATLTDGLLGGWTYGDKRWQGFLQCDMDVTVDLGRVERIHYVGMDFMQSVGPCIWLPAQVAFYGSEDGVHFRPLCSLLRNDVSDKCPDLLFRNFHFRGEATVRYVRCVARNSGVNGGWLFTDEIVIF